MGACRGAALVPCHALWAGAGVVCRWPADSARDARERLEVRNESEACPGEACHGCGWWGGCTTRGVHGVGEGSTPSAAWSWLILACEPEGGVPGPRRALSPPGVLEV